MVSYLDSWSRMGLEIIYFLNKCGVASFPVNDSAPFSCHMRVSPLEVITQPSIISFPICTSVWQQPHMSAKLDWWSAFSMSRP